MLSDKLALNKSAAQSSTTNIQGYSRFQDTNAVDGNPSSLSCAGSETEEHYWWYVDLEETYIITSTTITGRSDGADLPGFQIFF